MGVLSATEAIPKTPYKQQLYDESSSLGHWFSFSSMVLSVLDMEVYKCNQLDSLTRSVPVSSLVVMDPVLFELCCFCIQKERSKNSVNMIVLY